MFLLMDRAKICILFFFYLSYSNIIAPRVNLRYFVFVRYPRFFSFSVLCFASYTYVRNKRNKIKSYRTQRSTRAFSDAFS